MKRAAAVGDSPNRITLLRDADGDGVAEVRETFLDRAEPALRHGAARRHVLRRQHRRRDGIPLHDRAQPASARPGESCIDIKPGGHWTRSLLASPDGRKLYVGVGSLTNIGDNGMAAEEGRAAIHELDLESGASRIFASGLRNPVGMAWEPATGSALDGGQRARRAGRRDASRLPDIGRATAASTDGPTATGARSSTTACRRTPRWSRRP